MSFTMGTADQQFKFSKIELRKNEALGSGSYGVVCIAKCDELVCAAKLLFSVLFDIDDGIPPLRSPGRVVSPHGKTHRIPIKRFEQECRFLRQIKHPNIIQYLGTYRDPDSRALVLLMELMDESLTHFLERLSVPLPYYLQVGISHDIALALAYLHSNNIIHRDLSSNNVLLLQGSRAKVSDFGMSTLATSPSGNSRTTCPGTPAYMPPEALNEPPSYSEMLDSFSYGVILIQIVTMLFPNPTDRFTTMKVQDPRHPNSLTEAMFPVSEAVRRQEHIDMINEDHPLLPIAKHCLSDAEKDRPSSRDLCSRIEALKASQRYIESNKEKLDLEGVEKKLRDVRQECQQKHQLDLEKINKQLENAKQTIQSKDQILGIRTDRLNKLQRELSVKEKECSTLRLAIRRDVELQEQERAQDDIVQQKERQIERLQQQVDLQDQTVHDLQSVISRHEHSIDELQSQISRESQRCGLLLQKLSRADQSGKHSNKEGDDDDDGDDDYEHYVPVYAPKSQVNASNLHLELQKQISDLHVEMSSKDSIIQGLQRRLKQLEKEKEDRKAINRSNSPGVSLMRGSTAPSKIFGGCATSTGNKAYFRPSGCSEIYEFCSDSSNWSELLSCTSRSSTLVIIDNMLTVVGGENSKQCLSLQLNKWRPVFPQMLCGRHNSTAIKCGGYLVVAGGISDDGKCLSSVEVLKLSSRQWIPCSDLPFTLHSAAGAAINDQLYLLGGCTTSLGGPQRSVLTCSLKDLVGSSIGSSGLSNVERATPLRSNVSPDSSAVWQKLSNLPFCASGCVSAQGRLLAVGGQDQRGAQSSVHSYNFSTKSWELLLQLKAARSDCLVSVITSNSCSKLVVVGGYTDSGLTDSVEIIHIFA